MGGSGYLERLRESIQCAVLNADRGNGMKNLAQFSERHPVLLMPEEWEEMLNPELLHVEGVILPWKRKEGTGTVTSAEGSMENWRSSGRKAA